MTRNGIAGLDHIIVAVRDLEAARRNWGRLGFTLSPRGRHIGQDTANYCIMFPADYIELLGKADRAGAPEPTAQGGMGGDRLARFLDRREGPMAAAFAPESSAAETRAALAALGLHPSDPRPLGRELQASEGTVVPRFSLVSLPPEATPALDCFVCGHLTPELMRRPEWLAHPNGAVGIEGIHVLVDGTAAILPAYDRLFGLPGVTTTDAVVSLRLGSHRITFSTRDDFLTMHPKLDLDPAFPQPGIAALEIRVEQTGRTADLLRRGGVSVIEMPDGALAVPAAEANGAIVFFFEA